MARTAPRVQQPSRTEAEHDPIPEGRGVRVSVVRIRASLHKAGSPPVDANDVFLPRRRHRTGRIADDRGAMNYDRIEIAVALCCGVTFALVGWWEIARDIWSAVGRPAAVWRARDRCPGAVFSCSSYAPAVHRPEETHRDRIVNLTGGARLATRALVASGLPLEQPDPLDDGFLDAGFLGVAAWRAISGDWRGPYNRRQTASQQMKPPRSSR
jgi:hypothetical protein